MPGEENLIPQSKRTKEEQREIAKKGGRASGAARRRKKDLAQALQILLDKKYPQYDKSGKITGKITGTEAISAKLFQKALNGDIRAFETLRDTVGQKPVEKVMVAQVNQDIIDEVERMVLEDG